MEKRPWVIGAPAITLAGIGIALVRGTGTDSTIGVGCLVVALLWFLGLTYLWKKKETEMVKCSKWGVMVPEWFTEDFPETGETICEKDVWKRPYPDSGETEEHYRDKVRRWKEREGKPA